MKKKLLLLLISFLGTIQLSYAAVYTRVYDISQEENKSKDNITDVNENGVTFSLNSFKFYYSAANLFSAEKKYYYFDKKSSASIIWKNNNIGKDLRITSIELTGLCQGNKHSCSTTINGVTTTIFNSNTSTTTTISGSQFGEVGYLTSSESFPLNNGGGECDITKIVITYELTDIAVSDCSSKLSNVTTDWIAVQGKKDVKYEGVETYGGNSKDFTVGKVLYQRIEGIPNGIYVLEFYSAANAAQWEAGGVTTGPKIAQTYVIADIEQDIDMSVWSRAGGEEIDINDFARKFTVNVTDGTIEYGIKNIDVGGNWYVCKAKSLTYYGPSSVARITKDTKYGTICMPFDFTANGATLYTISGIKGNSIELKEVGTEGTEGAAGVPYIYQAKGTGNQSFSYKSGDIVAEPTEGANGLVGTFALTAVPKGCFVMQTQEGVQGFYYVDEDNAVYSGSNKCYLKAPSSNLVKSYYFGSDEETAIEAVNALMTGKAKIYDMNGRKLDRLQKGVNIVNGKKVIVK